LSEVYISQYPFFAADMVAVLINITIAADILMKEIQIEKLQFACVIKRKSWE
jgi:hypothetical protein